MSAILTLTTPSRALSGANIIARASGTCSASPLEVNHRLIDGLHIGRFVQDLQQRIDALAEAE